MSLPPDLGDDVGFRSIVTGIVAGALIKAAEDFMLIEVVVPVDEHGNYQNRVLVTGRESGTKLQIDVNFADVA